MKRIRIIFLVIVVVFFNQAVSGQEKEPKEKKGGILVDSGTGGKINVRTGEYLDPNMIKGFTGPDGSTYTPVQAGGYVDNEGNHFQEEQQNETNFQKRVF